MQCIQFRDVPPGEAPLEIRKAWEDLRLPPHSPDAVEGAFGGVITGQLTLDSGYPVDARTAIEILALHHPEATKWWRANTPHFFQPGACFIFSAGVCEVVNALPSITLPQEDGDGTMNVGEFLQHLKKVEKGDDPSRIPWIVTVTGIRNTFHLSVGELVELMRSRLTRPILLLLASFAAARVWESIDKATTDKLRKATREEGHAVLHAMHSIATEQGISVVLREMDQPLGWIEWLVQRGIVTEDEKGIVRPTPLSPREEERLRQLRGEDEDDFYFYQGRS